MTLPFDGHRSGEPPALSRERGHASASWTSRSPTPGHPTRYRESSSSRESPGVFRSLRRLHGLPGRPHPGKSLSAFWPEIDPPRIPRPRSRPFGAPPPPPFPKRGKSPPHRNLPPQAPPHDESLLWSDTHGSRVPYSHLRLQNDSPLFQDGLRHYGQEL